MLTAQHMSDGNLTLDTLAQMMNMGRTKFFGKVKELTGLSPNKYLLNARMQRAADLLADGELTVAEVCYKVGIQDPSYFNKLFKSAYGVPPSKYKREA
jgi:AraC-like DNA-binding protein